VRYAFIEAEKAKYPVRVLCGCLQVSASGYYGWQASEPSARSREDARLSVSVAAEFRRLRGRYGSPRIHGELRGRGERVSRKRVARLMRERDLRARLGRPRVPRTTDARHGLPVAENVLARRFTTTAPNVAWVGDVTYLPTAEGWRYLAVLLDLYSRRVVGFALSASNDTALALAALRQALVLRAPAAGLIHHTDRGSPYASAAYQAVLTQHGIVPSMSRSGNCYDNAVAESFFSTLEHELGAEIEDKPAAEVEALVRSYIEDFYNAERRHSTLGGVSPVAFEQAFRAQRGNRGPGGFAPGPPKSTSSSKRNQERPGKAA
jgi:transposase InsO family protein